MKEKKDELGEIVSKEMGKVIAEGKGMYRNQLIFWNILPEKAEDCSE
jgi:acyl-CoA reductase-like NAD-dependent aldehyde dehydrogenase